MPAIFETENKVAGFCCVTRDQLAHSETETQLKAC